MLVIELEPFACNACALLVTMTPASLSPHAWKSVTCKINVGQDAVKGTGAEQGEKRWQSEMTPSFYPKT